MASIKDLLAALRKGYRRWVNAGRDPARFRSATVKTSVNGQQRVLQEALPMGVHGRLPGG
ncbi:MAG TPA: hypothetical protein VKA37_12120 [Halobacteriales archaeon]|nr:hypothetical protein [Halobacteriales archaeon]